MVNKETGGTPATAIYVAYGYTYGETGQIIVTAFVGDKYYQSTFQVHTVTKDSGHDGTTGRSVGVAADASLHSDIGSIAVDARTGVRVCAC